MKYKVAFFSILFFIILVHTPSNGVCQQTGDYLGIPWNSRFPVIEKRFPGVEFVEEDRFHVTLFRLNTPAFDTSRIEFKLFEEQLISVTHYYDGPITSFMNEKFVHSHISNLGQRKEIRKTKANSLAGTADVQIWEYENNLVLFRSYPEGQKAWIGKKENSIIFIFKPTFDKMVYYRKHSEGDPVDTVIDYDYLEF